MKRTEVDENDNISYHNGCVVGEKTDAAAPIDGIDAASIVGGITAGAPFFGLVNDVRVYKYALSQAEIVGVMAASSKSCPLVSPANLSDTEPAGQRAVDFNDYAVFAESWLEEGLQ